MSGQMQSNTIAPVPASQNTLDEPVHTTILRDLKIIGIKLGHVILPRGKGVQALKDWDLWGPLLLCLTLAIMLSQGAPEEQSALVFAIVFVVVWVGAAIVTINAQLLGGTISFFQSVCVLGYCIFPLTLASIVTFILSHAIHGITFTFIKGGVVLGGFVWSTISSIGFIRGLVPPARRALAVYPVLLFYLIISFVILAE
eukprot:TRINITY_DN1503_c0_g1_i2.p1 TRINITY_DN1503_c0_g1~~TRINITY_DN1503_c0_g1_i2.p1  ORF type:complete len:199 (+),score=35.45 TRINITY_DN1503_c0_g1_i2:62-658(+)